MTTYTVTMIAPGHDDRLLYEGDDLETAIIAAHAELPVRIPNVKIQALYQAPTHITASYGDHPDEYIRVEAVA